MNVVITIVLVVVFAILGVCIGCCTCLSKIEQLEREKQALKEWLTVSRKTNKALLKENDELRADIESIINGKGIILNEEETKID